MYEKQLALYAGGDYDNVSTDPNLFYLYAGVMPGKTALSAASLVSSRATISAASLSPIASANRSTFFRNICKQH